MPLECQLEPGLWSNTPVPLSKSREPAAPLEAGQSHESSPSAEFDGGGQAAVQDLSQSGKHSAVDCIHTLAPHL